MNREDLPALSLRDSLSRTRQATFGRVAALMGATEINDGLWDGLEALLIGADVGLPTTQVIIAGLKKRVRQEGFTRRDQLVAVLREALLNTLVDPGPDNLQVSPSPAVLLILGANGSGKTTTIARLAHHYTQQGRRVLLAAGDTFRAAGIEQLQQWGQRLNVPVVTGQQGGDPGAVVFDALDRAAAEGHDLLIVDTAGRLHTNTNLLAELQKIGRIAGKRVEGAPHETWLILDGTTGQNALAQARQFGETMNVTGVILTKLDSSAKGGVVFAIGQQLKLPVRFLGVGEGQDDLLPFDAENLVDSLLA